MLVRCNQGCKLNGGMTECKLKIETNEAICMECGDEVTHVSGFAKTSMKINKDIIKDNKRGSFVFNCKTCDENVRVITKKSKLCGSECPTPSKCLINTTESMKNAIKHYGDKFND